MFARISILAAFYTPMPKGSVAAAAAATTLVVVVAALALRARAKKKRLQKYRACLASLKQAGENVIALGDEPYISVVKSVLSALTGFIGRTRTCKGAATLHLKAFGGGAAGELARSFTAGARDSKPGASPPEARRAYGAFARCLREVDSAGRRLLCRV